MVGTDKGIENDNLKRHGGGHNGQESKGEPSSLGDTVPIGGGT